MDLIDGLTPRRVFCIGCNYDEHIKELGSCDADRCVVFMKPATCLVPPGRTIVMPKGVGAIHHEVELVLVIGREGKDISGGLDHVAGITLGLDMTLRDVQTRAKQNGHPWELCKAFDDSAPIGKVRPRGDGVDLGNIEMQCLVNGELRQDGNTRDMLFPVDRLVRILSRTWRLLPGDLIYTGTPPGVGPVEPGDTITVRSPRIGEFEWTVA